MNEIEDRLERAAYLLRHGPEHLARTLATTQDTTLGLKDRLHVTQSLVAYGQVAAAEDSLKWLDALVPQLRGAEQLAEKFRKQLDVFKKFNIDKRLKKNQPQEGALLDSKKPVFFERPNSKGLVVVFATNFNNLEISLPVLHCILENYGYSILYLKDASRKFFLTGVTEVADSFDALLKKIGKIKRDHGGARLVVMGHSSSGYTGLLASILLQADAYVGFSIRSDLSTGSELSPGLLLTKELRDEIPARHLTDLRPMLEQSAFPRDARIYFGAQSRLDADHAKRLAGIDRIKVLKVDGANHSVVSNLIGNGEFGALLHRFLV